MGNTIGRLLHPFTFARERITSLAYETFVPLSKSDKQLHDGFSDFSSNVDEVTISRADFNKIRQLLTQISEKQFEAAYQQALNLKTSGKNRDMGPVVQNQRRR